MALRRPHGQADGAGGQGRFFSLGGVRVLYGKADLAAATLFRSTKGQDDFSVILLFFCPYFSIGYLNSMPGNLPVQCPARWLESGAPCFLYLPAPACGGQPI
ncbi:hypothetical protein FFI39_006620 [Janthinobacterium sp. KBS0711]|uniref:hypothetical protein n=1 Tax=Janthinobacterium sp. KBS0711 TaxID=1649647 RepID=UPI000ABF7A4D|nr:hypothetical protein [Janthinobacterium sp. KBS0711]TSD70708.1 hypothetical protein FFI39_006620 [Janthinobacterium sp. KBS0711]